MSIAMTRGDGVTVFTLTSDPNSACPPLCQILGGLCYSPQLCSVSQRLRNLQGSSLSALGALQIMTGVFNLGLGPILLTSGADHWYDILAYTGFPIWLGILFIVFGITTILSERFPSPCLVMASVILNLCGVAFSITAIVLYSIQMAISWDPWFYRSCDSNDRYDSYDGYWYRSQTTTPSSDKEAFLERCLEGKQLFLMFVRSIYILMVVLSTLELCLVISSATLGIKALRQRQSTNNKSTVEPELYKPLLETTNPTV